MSKESEITVTCDDPDKIVGAMNSVMPKLNPETRKRLNLVKHTLLQRFGKQGMYERVKGLTVEQILRDSESLELLRTVESGKKDGIGFELLNSDRNKEDSAQGENHR